MAGDPLAAVNFDGSRFYQINEQAYPSVTEILSALSKPALIEWSASTERQYMLEASAELYDEIALKTEKLSKPAWVTSLTSRLTKAKAYHRKVDKAGDIGTATHHLIEWALRKRMDPQTPGKQPLSTETPPEAIVAYQKFLDWFDSQKLVPILLEATVWSSEHRYAGTLDLAAERQGHPGLVVIDFKTGNPPRDSRPDRPTTYAEHHLQVQAYADAIEEMKQGQVVEGYVVRLPKTAGPSVDVVPIPLCEVNSTAFRCLTKVWQWRWDASHPKTSMVAAVRNLKTMSAHEKGIAGAAKFIAPEQLKDGKYVWDEAKT